MRVRVDQAKHDTNRYTILSEIALEVLRKYFREYFSTTGYKPDDWLFPGQDRSEHIHVKTIKNTLIKLRNRLHLGNNISAHTLRHCFAAHSLEDGTDPVYIQQMLGHKRLQTTLTYYDKKKIMASMRERTPDFIGTIKAYLPYYLS
jgi:site-specific recombinase XerD